jgi:hypothetical protein
MCLNHRWHRETFHRIFFGAGCEPITPRIDVHLCPRTSNFVRMQNRAATGPAGVRYLLQRTEIALGAPKALRIHASGMENDEKRRKQQRESCPPIVFQRPSQCKFLHIISENFFDSWFELPSVLG